MSPHGRFAGQRSMAVNVNDAIGALIKGRPRGALEAEAGSFSAAAAQPLRA